MWYGTCQDASCNHAYNYAYDGPPMKLDPYNEGLLRNTCPELFDLYGKKYMQ